MADLKITRFGGLLPRIHEQDIGANMAQECVDVDLSRGTLKPFRTDLKVSDKSGAALWTDGCCFITSGSCRASFAKLHGDCCYVVSTGDGEYPMIAKLDDACIGEWCRLGFPCDLAAPNVQSLAALPEDFNREGRQYYYTLVNDFGQESMPSEISELLVCGNDGDVVISGLPAEFDGWCVSGLRIYCAVTGLDYGEGKEQHKAVFLQVGEVPLGVGSFVHKAHTVYGCVCETEEYAPPSECMHSIQYGGNGQFGALVRNELWLSEPLKPHAWNEAFRYGRFRGMPLRFLCGEKTGYVLTDAFPAVVEMESPCQTQGCRRVENLEETLPLVSYQSACLYNGSCFYASTDGLVMLTGNQARVVSLDFWTAEQWRMMNPETLRGAVHNGWYYGTSEQGSFRLKIPDTVHDKADVESLTELSVRPYAWARSDSDRLFFVDDGGVFEFAAGLDWKTFKWVGRLNVQPGFVNWSAYKVVHSFEPVYVKHTGYVFRRGALVRDSVVLGEHTFSDSRPHRLKVGFSTLEFDVEIQSKGEVREYAVATSVAELAQR